MTETEHLKIVRKEGEWSEAIPPGKARLVASLPGFVVTEHGNVDAPAEVLGSVRYADASALYDLHNLPERPTPDRVHEALAVRGIRPAESDLR